MDTEPSGRGQCLWVGAWEGRSSVLGPLDVPSLPATLRTNCLVAALGIILLVSGPRTLTNHTHERRTPCNLTSTGVDVVFDPVGGSQLFEALKCVAWGAQYLVIGFASGDIPKVWLWPWL